MKNNILGLFTAVLFLSACATQETNPAADSASASEPIYEIQHITGNLYRARSNNHYTAFLVTSEGTILADPTTVDLSNWLKDEIWERFGSTVRYVLYSHHHWDHISGGAAFADTAIFIGHEEIVPALEWEIPGNYIKSDKNGDGLLGPTETTGGLANTFDLMDSDGDGQLTGAEINQHIIRPTLTFSDHFSVTLGDSEVHMAHSGSNHSEDGSIIYFVNEKAIFNSDFISIKRLPFGLSGTDIDLWIDSVDVALNLDANFVLPAHGETGDRQDLLDYRQYFVDLRESVRTAVQAGMSLEETQESITLDKYSDWQLYERAHKPNIAEVYGQITED